jgi:hypothetical protein
MESAKYTISGRLEETECDYCGCPLQVGDIAFEYHYRNARGYARGGVACCHAHAELYATLKTGPADRVLQEAERFDGLS